MKEPETEQGVAQPGSAPEWGSLNNPQTLSKTLITNFIASRRQGLSPRTLEFYHDRLTRAWCIVGLQIQAPKRDKRILPSLTEEQVEHLVTKVGNLRDECILRLSFDSGIRLSELTSIQRGDFDWETNTITVIGKGNKQRRAPFT